MNNDEIQDLITQLKNLQLQQTELLVRLEKARQNETETKVGPPKAREFAIGDKVRIKNPTRFQSDRGVITKIGASRTTVQTKSGSLILRAPKNLILER
jgi:dsDNA-specific endonuclease/ATPase MutS2